MKTNMLRLISLILVVLMTVSVLAACSKGGEETGTDVGSSNVTTESEPAGEVTAADLVGQGFKVATDANIKVVKVSDAFVIQAQEGTTLEQLLKVVTPEEGCTLKVFGADNKEVTNKTAVLVDKSAVKVFDKDGKEKTVITISVIKKQDSTTVATSLNGYKFRFGAQNATHFKDASTTTGKINVDVINNIKKRYNCTVDIVGFNGITLVQEVVNQCRAGQIPADVVEANISHARSVAKQGCIADFAKCTTLNKKLFTNGMTESVTHKGHIYGVAFASMSVNPMGVLFNKTIVDKYMKQKDFIYKHYKAGTWNFDNFEVVAKACTVDTNGDGKNDIYGINSNTNIIGMALTANAGGTALKVNERVEATMCNDKGIYALTWLKEKIYNPGYWNYDPDIYVSISSFANGEAAMFVSYLSWYGQIASSAKFEMGFVPMPKGPSQSNYITGAYDGGIFFVPKTNEKNINIVGTFLNELAATSPKHINNSISSMARNGFDATAQSVYKWAVTNTSPEFSIGVFGSEISAKVDQSVTDKSKAPKTVMESIKGAAQKKCDDFYAPLYK
ncbi:MAG: extracellular solute-binding protein [Clostridia bacterium]|nr:extracellular solute-binding protein [Clostridia bacterium]